MDSLTRLGLSNTKTQHKSSSDPAVIPNSSHHFRTRCRESIVNYNGWNLPYQMAINASLIGWSVALIRSFSCVCLKLKQHIYKDFFHLQK